MAMSNSKLIQKGIIVANDIATAGKLNPKQADAFIDYVIDETTLKNNVRVVKFRNEQMDIDKIGVGDRVAVPAVEAVDPGIRRKINTSKVTLTPKEIMVPVEISDTFLEINLEGQTAEEHIMRMFAKQLANDLEQLYLFGNTLGAATTENAYYGAGSTTQYVKDGYLAMMNGWLRLADSGNVVDAGGANISANLFSQMLNAMPSKFKKNRQLLRFLSSAEHEQLYRETVASRATASGDTALSSVQNLTPFGVQLIPVPLLPDTPEVVEHVVMNNDGVTATALSYQPVVASSVTVLPSTLSTSPVTPYILNTDYSLDATNGTVTRLAGAIGGAATVKVTYQTYGQILLASYQNLIIAIGRDIRLEKDRDIYKRVNQYAITCKVDVQFEEVTAVVKAINVGLA